MRAIVRAMSQMTPPAGTTHWPIRHALNVHAVGVLPCHVNGRDNQRTWYRRERGKVERVESEITVQGEGFGAARIRRRLGLTPDSKIVWCELVDEVVVQRASKYSSWDIHEAVFDTPPERRSVADMDAGIRSGTQHKHAGGGYRHPGPGPRHTLAGNRL